MRPHRLVRPRTPLFQGGDTGSNPVGDATPPATRSWNAVWWRPNSILPGAAGLWLLGAADQRDPSVAVVEHGAEWLQALLSKVPERVGVVEGATRFERK
jgi:hypothetical protein